jgi:hypothetical protein
VKARLIVPLAVLAAVAAAVWLWPRSSTPPVAMAPAAPAPAAVTLPAEPTAPAAAPAAAQAPADGDPRRLPSLLAGQVRGGDPPGDGRALQRAMSEYTARQMRLVANLSRANVSMPAELKTLFKREREGASPEQLRRYVRESFPTDALLRIMTIRWINDSDPSHRASAPLPPPTPGGLRPLGKIEKTETPPDNSPGNGREASPARTVPVQTP